MCPTRILGIAFILAAVTLGAPPALAAPALVPCHPAGSGHVNCQWYPPGDGHSGGTPVLSSTGGTVGYLHQGTNWVICQQLGRRETSGNEYHNSWWAWTEADNGQMGWVNALWAHGGDNDAGFQNVPFCNGAHGSPPESPQAQPPTQGTPPQDCGKSLGPLSDFGGSIDISHKGKNTPMYNNGLTSFHGRVFQLRTKKFEDESQGNIAQGYKPGDKVWVDVSTDNGRSWVQCGPYGRDRTNWVPHLGKWMRVCINADGITQCATNGDKTGPNGGKWWDDLD